MSARNGRIDMTAATPWGVAGNLGLAWRMPSETLLTWDALLDLAVVAYWTRRRRPVGNGNRGNPVRELNPKRGNDVSETAGGAGLAHLFGDYVVQSDWMANEKTQAHAPAVAHALTYAACFLPITRSVKALSVIAGTHYVIDHWRLARHVVWAKNQVAPKAYRYPWRAGSGTGYHQDRPPWMAVWLMIVADNTMHLAINRWALARWAS